MNERQGRSADQIPDIRPDPGDGRITRRTGRSRAYQQRPGRHSLAIPRTGPAGPALRAGGREHPAAGPRQAGLGPGPGPAFRRARPPAIGLNWRDPAGPPSAIRRAGSRAPAARAPGGSDRLTTARRGGPAAAGRSRLAVVAGPAIRGSLMRSRQCRRQRNSGRRSGWDMPEMATAGGSELGPRAQLAPAPPGAGGRERRGRPRDLRRPERGGAQPVPGISGPDRLPMAAAGRRRPAGMP